MTSTAGAGMTYTNWFSQGSQRDKWFGARQASSFGANNTMAPTGQVWCIEMGPPEGNLSWSAVSSPRTAYLLWKANGSSNQQVRAATQVALYRYAFAGIQDNWEQSRLTTNLTASDDISVLAQELWTEAGQRMGPYNANTLSLVVNGDTGTISNVGVRNANGWVPGFTGTLTLNGPAEFTNGSTSRNITSTGSAQSFEIRATGNGNVSATLTFNNLPNTQISRGTHPTLQDAAAVRNPVSLTERTGTHPMSQSFQPMVETNVVNERVQLGQNLQDRVEFQAAPGSSWAIANDAWVPVTFQYAIFGPFDTPQAETALTPGYGPVFQAWTDHVRTSGPGTATISSTNPVTEEGFYTWVWRVRPGDQPASTRDFIDGAWTDNVWIRNETSVVPRTVEITSQIQDAIYRDDASGVVTDRIFQAGFPEDTFNGAYGWTGDAQVEHTLYGPYLSRPTDATDTPASLAVQTVTTDPVDGEFDIVFDEVEDIGWYVVRSQVTQSSRINALHTSAGDQDEQFNVRFSPSAVTEVRDQVIELDEGGEVLLADVVTPLAYRDVDGEPVERDWPTIGGNPVDVTYRGYLYGPLDTPPVQSADTPDDAPLAFETGEVVFDGTGQDIEATVTEPGYYTWVWEMLVADQTADVVELLYGGDWRDDYGIDVETTLVRYPTVITSVQDRFVIGHEDAVIDHITLDGFPVNHGQVDGDVTEVSHHLIGPFEEPATDDMLLDDYRDMIVETVVTDTLNGVHEVTFAAPGEIGHYVVVSEYTGDHRTMPFVTSMGDVNEQVNIVRVTTQAVKVVVEGEAIHDIAYVEGDIPEGSQLVFELWRQGEGELDSDELVHTTEPIDIDGPGEYMSPLVEGLEAGKYYFREILVEGPGECEPEEPGEPGEPCDPDDPTCEPEEPGEPGDPDECDPDRPRTRIHYGKPRLPNETTHVVKVTTTAVDTIYVGEEAHDVAHVEGSVPDGTTLEFELWKRGDGGVETDVLVAVTDLIDVDEGAGDYTSPSVRIDEAGEYYWRELLLGTPEDPDGDLTVIHYGEPRLPNETTRVIVREDGGLARTGAGGVALVAITGLALAGGGGFLVSRVKRREN